MHCVYDHQLPWVSRAKIAPLRMNASLRVSKSSQLFLSALLVERPGDAIQSHQLNVYATERGQDPRMTSGVFHPPPHSWLVPSD